MALDRLKATCVKHKSHNLAAYDEVLADVAAVRDALLAPEEAAFIIAADRTSSKTLSVETRAKLRRIAGDS